MDFKNTPSNRFALLSSLESQKAACSLVRSLVRHALKTFVMSITFLMIMGASEVAAVDLWVAPTKLGSGDGSSAANAAEYRNVKFWRSRDPNAVTVQTRLQSTPVTVIFKSGTYEGNLGLYDIGHPLNALVLQAETTGAVVLQANGAAEILMMSGVRNTTIIGLTFTGGVSENATLLGRSSKSGCRGVKFQNCTWQNLPNVRSSALSIMAGCREIAVQDCVFSNVGMAGEPTSSPSMIYCYNTQSVEIKGTTAGATSFTNCTGSYIYLENDTEFVAVTNCAFRSTSTNYNREFIRVSVLNESYPGDEFYGTNFQFNNNTFSYDAVAVPPVDDANRRWGIIFSSFGYNVDQSESPHLDYEVDAADQAILTGTDLVAKRNLLKNDMGLDSAKVLIYNNTTTGTNNLAGMIGYWHSASQPFPNPINIDNWPWKVDVLAAVPLVRNSGFEFLGNRRRCWTVAGCRAPFDHPPFNADSAKAIRLGKAASATGQPQLTSVGQTLKNDLATGWQSLHWRIAVGSDVLGLDQLDSGGNYVPRAIFKAKIYHDETNAACASIVIRLMRETVNGQNNYYGQIGYEKENGVFVATNEPNMNILLATDADGDGIYNGNGDVMKWYQMRVDTDYSGTTPKFKIFVGQEGVAGSYAWNSGEIVPAGGSAPQPWLGSNPVTGSRVLSVTFESYGSNVILDTIW